MPEETKQTNPTEDPAYKGEDKLRQDIAHILEEVKIPARRDFKAEADTASHAKKPSVVATTPTNQPENSHPSTSAKLVPETSSVSPPDSSADVRPLRTYKDDVQDLVQAQKMTLVHAAALESDKVHSQQQHEEKAPKARPGHRTAIAASFITLIGIGILALGAVFFVKTQRAINLAIPEDTSLMFAEQTATVSVNDLGPRELKLLLAQARDQANVTLGAITRIVPLKTIEGASPSDPDVEAIVTAPDFLAATGSNAPAELIRAIGDDFFLGIHAVDRTVPIIVLTVSSYERAFAAMLSWENSMSTGLEPLYPAVLQQTQAGEGTIRVNQFEDAIIRNFDARVLKDPTGEIKLLYSFPTRNILIIAESPYSFVEALSRLQAERRLQ